MKKKGDFMLKKFFQQLNYGCKQSEIIINISIYIQSNSLRREYIKFNSNQIKDE
jgi:hypothetical protein